MANTHPAHLPPSELGTKDYWETFYARTLSHLSTKNKPPGPETENDNGNATSNPADEDESPGSDSDAEEDEDADDDSDPGTSWFAEHNAPDKVLQFLTSDEFPLSPYNTSQAKNGSPKILDLGTGNGSMLALLRRKGGFRGEDMVGVDYSIGSVQLARELQRLRIHSAYLGGSDSEDEDDEDQQQQPREEGASADDSDIRFEEWDILSSTDSLSDSPSGTLDWFPYARGGFDIVLDKGTFDAVSLCEDVDDDGAAQRRVCERYPAVARRLVRRGGFLVVTSCNWTEEELVKWFTSSGSSSGTGEDGDGGMKVWGRVDYPRFQFGGKEGQGVCTVCFQRAS